MMLLTMAQKDCLLALMHHFSSVNLGCSGGETDTQDIRSRSLDSSQRSFQQFVANNLTKMNQGDMVKKKGAKKYSTTSEEVYPVREKDDTRNKVNTKVDVRHVREVKKFNTVTAYPLGIGCSQNRCPVMQERLKQHKNEHHRHHTRPKSARKSKEQGINVSPTISGQGLSNAILPLKSVQSVQTDITLQDVVVHKDSTYSTVPDTLSYVTDVPLKRCETRDIVPNCSFYKEHLQNEIMGWLLNVPIFYSNDFTPKYLKDNIVRNLVDKIDKMTPYANNKIYEDEIKVEIENCLNTLPMWLPNAVADQTLFKNGLRNKLYDKIKQLNAKFLGIKDENENVEPICIKNVESVDSDNLHRDLMVKEIHAWLAGIKFTSAVSRKRTTDNIMKKISPLLNVSVHTRSYKLMLKGEIVDVLNELPIDIVNTKNKNIYFNKCAEDLANKLLSIQLKSEVPVRREFSRSRELVTQQCISRVLGVPIYNSRLRLTVYDKVNKALQNAKIHGKSNVKEEICDAILNSLETLRSGAEVNINNDVYYILRRTNMITEEKAKSIAKKIKLYVKIALKQDKETRGSSFLCLKPQLSGVLSIYRSNSHNPVTSTPKKPTKKDVPRLNPEEKAYMKKVADLIRAWMETLPTKFDDDKNYKETIINDLAGDIMDEVKREQLSPETNTEKDKHLNYFMYRWLVRFNVFDDLNDAKPLIQNFLEKLKQIPVPPLTAPQHGTRQTMHFLKRIEKDYDFDDEFVPTGIDILEDQISVWMNEQPSEIYATDNKKKRGKMVKDLALTLQDRLRNKSPEDEIENDINRWLKRVVKPKEKEHLGLLAQNLKEKVINAPQDKTLEALHEKRKKQRAEYYQNEPSTAAPEPDDVSHLHEDHEETMKEFILKYIQHNYDIDDAMARGAFAQLLKVELRNLSAPTRKEVYDNFANQTSHEKFKPEKLNEVLEYVKMISDWLRNIPIESSYNTVGNVARIEYVNDLARNIQEVEDQRREYPNDMDYDNYMSSVISQSIRTYKVPVLREHQDNVPLMVNQLLSKIVANRSAMIQEDSIMSDIKEQDLGEFIEDYIRINGRDIADDQLKLEAWTARLQEEIKKMLHEGADPSTLCKAQVYEKFSKVPIPSVDSVRRFSLEIGYVKEISDWLKNMPLLPIDNVPKAQEERIQMMTELAQKIADREAKKSSDPNDNSADKELVQYISNWLSKVPLDPRKNIEEPILIQQLMNRVNKVGKKNVTLPDDTQEKIKTSDGAKQKGFVKDPGAHIVQFIENWCNKLPIRGDDPNALKIVRDGIAKNLYQKIGELSVDPRVVNDDILFKDLLEDEIDTQLENLPQDPELQNQREMLKDELLSTVLNMKKVIEVRSTGDNYKHKLETTIDAAIPDPVQSRQMIEPGFEIYKNNLANMFILENFDHSNEDVKAKYENKIKEEIDKYFESAQNKNALPISKDQMYNDLYSELFKVPMPDKEAVIDEVEEIKTRCEVEDWFQSLPLKEAEGVIDYLEWEQIVSTLSKKIHEIEKYESNPDEKIRNEIVKWLGKIPLLPGQEVNIDRFTDKLQEALKSSKKSRKYVATEPRNAIKGKAIKRHEAKQSPNSSQVAGPYHKTGTWVSPPVSPTPIPNKPAEVITHTHKKRSGELIEEIVEDWCNQLPIIGDQTQNKIIKDNVSTQIIIKIYELNMDADIFNDDIIYDHLLDEELDKMMSDLVGCCNLERSKPARKHQLIEMIKSIKPLIKEERSKYEYKAELNDTVASILKDHDDTKAKMTEFNKLKDDIVDYFVEYNYNKSDNEAKQFYKAKVHDAVLEYFTNIQNKGEQVDPLIRRNQLLCELAKIPIPNNSVLKEEAEEIKLKNEVEQFFEKNSLDDKSEKTEQMKKTLAKRLNDIEKLGHTSMNDKKMVSEIDKCLTKLDKHVDSRVIEDFVNNLKNNEAIRKAPPIITITANESNMYSRPSDAFSNRLASQVAICCPGCQQAVYSPQTGLQQPAQYLQVPEQLDMSHCQSYQQWLSIEPATPIPMQTTAYHDPYAIHGMRPESDMIWQPPSTDQSQYQSGFYADFKTGSFRKSSLVPQSEVHSQYNSNFRQPSDIIPAQRVGSPHVVDALRPNQMFDGNVYPEPIIQGVNGNANQFPQNQSFRTPVPERGGGYQHFEASHPASLAQPRLADMSQNQPVHYEHFRPPLTSSVPPKQHISPAQFGQLNQLGVHPQASGQISPYSASLHQRSGYETPVYGQIATPRSVQGEATQFDPANVGEVTSDSLFQVPTFVPRPLIDPLVMPRRQPAEGYRSTPLSSRSSRRNTAGVNRGWNGPRDVESSENPRYRCRCDKKLKKYDSGPFCMIPMDEYCNDCGGFCQMWCKMPLPSCFYMH